MSSVKSAPFQLNSKLREAVAAACTETQMRVQPPSNDEIAVAMEVIRRGGGHCIIRQVVNKVLGRTMSRYAATKLYDIASAELKKERDRA